jgi:hypothetical protein
MNAIYELAEKIHRLLADYRKCTGSEDDATCALKIAHCLWTRSTDINVHEECPQSKVGQVAS